MTKPKLKYQKKFVDKLNELDLKDLITVTLECSMPDDYDGCYTGQGAWKYNTCLEFLYQKLFDMGLSKENMIPDGLLY